jgi:hypothetical protein
MWFDSAGWGVTPAAAGVRVARGRAGRQWPTPPPTGARRAREGCVFSVSSSFSPFLRCELRCLRNRLLASASLLGSRSDPLPTARLDRLDLIL